MGEEVSDGRQIEEGQRNANQGVDHCQKSAPRRFRYNVAVTYGNRISTKTFYGNIGNVFRIIGTLSGLIGDGIVRNGWELG